MSRARLLKFHPERQKKILDYLVMGVPAPMVLSLFGVPAQAIRQQARLAKRRETIPFKVRRGTLSALLYIRKQLLDRSNQDFWDLQLLEAIDTRIWDRIEFPYQAYRQIFSAEPSKASPHERLLNAIFRCVADESQWIYLAKTEFRNMLEENPLDWTARQLLAELNSRLCWKLRFGNADLEDLTGQDKRLIEETLVQKLKPQEAQVISGRFGLTGPRLTGGQLAAMMNLSRTRRRWP